MVIHLSQQIYYGVCREATVVQNSCTTSCCGLSGIHLAVIELEASASNSITASAIPDKQQLVQAMHYVCFDRTLPVPTGGQASGLSNQASEQLTILLPGQPASNHRWGDFNDSSLSTFPQV